MHRGTQQMQQVQCIHGDFSVSMLQFGQLALRELQLEGLFDALWGLRDEANAML